MLVELLDSSQVLAHPVVTGELVCGNLHQRDDVLRLLNELPQAPVASHEEALHIIVCNKLMGRGIDYIDAHLLASTALANTVFIWTRDKLLQKIAPAGF